MKIVTYSAVSGDPSEKNRHIALIFHDGERWGTFFGGATPEEATTKAQGFWDDKVEKERKSPGRGSHMKKPVQPAPVDDDVGDIL